MIERVRFVHLLIFRGGTKKKLFDKLFFELDINEKQTNKASGKEKTNFSSVMYVFLLTKLETIPKCSPCVE